MRIVLDAMGSDDHPDPEVIAAIEAQRLWGDRVLLCGPEDLLKEKTLEHGGRHVQIDYLHAPEVLEMTDKPARAARGKAENSMAVGMDLIKAGQADAFVTAGNTGGAMANALFRIGRVKGVKRPGLTAALPVAGGYAVMIDIGANTDCKPEYLLQFALMGSAYVQGALGIEQPRVGLLSNGEEPGKGNQLVKETYPLLEESGLDFIGNVEPKEIFAGEAEVVITDGFAGNIFIKTSEALAKFLLETVRDEITSGMITAVGGLLAKPAFSRVRKLLDPSEYGAAPLLGIDGLVFVGHGRSDARALVSAIKVARQAVEANTLDLTREVIQSRLAKE
jgi:glycerol-3-phosphate acyltransferase PlsX